MKLSVVIPSYNGKQLLEKHLPSVVNACASWEKDGGKFEIIIVDDASADSTAYWLKDAYPKVRLIRNQQNLRFGESCNRGVKEARGEIIVLLNNDVQPEPDFLKSLLVHFARPDVFAVGCKEINAVGNAVLFGGRGVSEFWRGLLVHWRPQDQESRRTTWVSAGSAAYRRELWLKLGGMDRLFRPAYEEDRDVSWQALKSGYDLVFELDSVVTHIHEITNRKVFGKEGSDIYSMKNQLLFVWKNISSPLLLIQHVFWLPYHLLFTTVRTKGLFFISFVLALCQLPEALASRARASKHWRRSDEEILGNH